MYVRYDASLLRAFTGHPRLEVPPGPSSRPAHVCELRTYEARSATALERKIAMFNEAELTLFRSIGMTPVFFGENLFGTRLPSLTYMLTFEDMTARYKAWNVFGSHPDWLRINKDEKYASNGSVTATNVAYLRPLAFSQVRWSAERQADQGAVTALIGTQIPQFTRIPRGPVAVLDPLSRGRRSHLVRFLFRSVLLQPSQDRRIVRVRPK